MNLIKSEILSKICYTDLVYGRINKKLKTNYSISEIKTLLYNLIKESPESSIQKIGKNFYILNPKNNIRITVNSQTFRVITVDRV